MKLKDIKNIVSPYVITTLARAYTKNRKYKEETNEVHNAFVAGFSKALEYGYFWNFNNPIEPGEYYVLKHIGPTKLQEIILGTALFETEWTNCRDFKIIAHLAPLKTLLPDDLEDSNCL